MKKKKKGKRGNKTLKTRAKNNESINRYKTRNRCKNKIRAGKKENEKLKEKER